MIPPFILCHHRRWLTAIAMCVLGLAANSAMAVVCDTRPPSPAASFTDAASFGFSPEASGVENTKALQQAVDQTGTIVVSRPGTYKIAGTIYIGSHTSLSFGANVLLQKVNEGGAFSHVFLNKGALTKTYDEQIEIEGLNLAVNGIDTTKSAIFGLRGQVAFFYVKDLRIHRFRCMDLGKAQFCIQVCSFEDAIIDDVVIKGDKDGVHFGWGKRFTVRNGIFQTYDDAIALNAHDYATSNPELGWLENGVIENCHDLNAEATVGFFCRILAGAWSDWREGMEVQQADTVVSEGRLYRVMANPDGKVYRSVTRPTHASGSQVLDGIKWIVVQTGDAHTAGVRNVVFRDIFLEKPRVAFSIHFDQGAYSRSYYPGSPIPQQKNLTFEGIRVLHDKPVAFLQVSTPVDNISLLNSSLKANRIEFGGPSQVENYLKTTLNIIGCTFESEGPLNLLTNRANGKEIVLKTSSNIAVHDNFQAKVDAGPGRVSVESDLPGLKR